MRSPLGALLAFGLGIAVALVAVTEKETASSPPPDSIGGFDNDPSHLAERVVAARRETPNPTRVPRTVQASGAPEHQQPRRPPAPPSALWQEPDLRPATGPRPSHKTYRELSWKKFRSEHPDLALSQAAEERRSSLSEEEHFRLQQKIEMIIKGDPPRCPVVGTFGPVQEWRFAGDGRIYARKSLHSEGGIEVLLIGDKGSQDKDCERLRALH